AFLGQAPVGLIQLLVQHGFEAAGPGLSDPVAGQLPREGLGAVMLQPTEGPPEQMHVGVNDLRPRGGLARGRRGALRRAPGPAGIARAGGTSDAFTKLRRSSIGRSSRGFSMVSSTRVGSGTELVGSTPVDHRLGTAITSTTDARPSNPVSSTPAFDAAGGRRG